MFVTCFSRQQWLKGNKNVLQQTPLMHGQLRFTILQHFFLNAYSLHRSCQGESMERWPDVDSDVRPATLHEIGTWTGTLIVCKLLHVSAYLVSQHSS